MKETKVYVDELPKSCSYCPCFDVDNDECNITDCPVDYIGPSVAKPDDCPLIDIKTHDRELVKEVCEKIKEQLGFIVDGQERIVCYGSATGDKTILAVLNQIQKEFEK